MVKIFAYIVAIPVAFILVCLFSVFLFGLIPVNHDYQVPVTENKIYVSSNGRHTFFVLPVETYFKDWAGIFPPEEYVSDVSKAPYVSFGWGDRAYYTKVESWDNLNLKTALRAALLPTNSAMHVQYLFSEPVPGESNIPLYLTDSQMQFLVNYIENTVQQTENKADLIPGVTRYSTDRFYEAHGTYHMFNTSNNWINQALKRMGIRAPVWSPLAYPVMWQLKKTQIDRDLKQTVNL